MPWHLSGRCRRRSTTDQKWHGRKQTEKTFHLRPPRSFSVARNLATSPLRSCRRPPPPLGPGRSWRDRGAEVCLLSRKTEGRRIAIRVDHSDEPPDVREAERSRWIVSRSVESDCTTRNDNRGRAIRRRRAEEGTGREIDRIRHIGIEVRDSPGRGARREDLAFDIAVPVEERDVLSSVTDEAGD
jgi:hypothetical protein